MRTTAKALAIAVAGVFVLTACSDKSDNKGATASANQTAAVNSAAGTGMPWIASKNTTRINTDNPQEAAVIVSRTLWMATGSDNRPGSIILTDPGHWQNALVSADLIHHPSNGPILFVDKNGIPEVTANEIKRLKPMGTEANNGVQLILVGNLGEKVEDQAKALGLKTDKVTGDNPAALAEAIDAYYSKVAGEQPASVIVGSMDSEEYTMPAINWIAHMPEPLLYVKKNEIPQETVRALQARGGKANIYILGPENAVSSDVEKELGKYGTVVRISGKDPYANAVAFAKYKDAKTGFGWGITTPGHNFSFVNLKSPDLAIAAAPFSHLGKHSPLLWTNQDSMPEPVMSYVMSLQPKYEMSPTEGPYNHGWLTGSEQSLSAKAQGEIDSMLEIVSKSDEGHGGIHH
ncbi:cell wall-binding repeat-containing protein [Paenibacillus caui]|uniref:cell wall-binding repeat-containing protein n=1 Tax=Paenibacillus caui TaxID=2873927 RepID=UPI001F4134D8|nr:cell wall-binding repeat-containing protein [Paenibacillus caui]